MIPKLIHIVTPAHIDESQRRCIEVAKQLHSRDWEVRIWSDPIEPTNHVLRRYLTKARSGAQIADIIRLDLVYEFGGFYIDSDMFLRNKLDQFCDNDRLYCCSEDGSNLTNAFFAAPVRHPALGALIAYLESNEPDWSRPPNETTGPWLFSQILRYRNDIYVLPRETFYPYNWDEHPPANFLPTTIAVHEWRGSWYPPTPPRKKGLRERLALKSRLRRLQAIVKTLVSAALPDNIVRTHSYRPTNYPVADEIITTTQHGIKMSLPGRDLSVVPSLVMDGQFEPAQEKFVSRLIRGGDWVIDVGANVGLFTLLAASKCGPFGRIFAVEPDDERCEYILRSARMNWFHDRIIIENVAASDAERTLILSGPDDRRGDQKVKGETESSNVNDRKVQAKRLDEIFPHALPIKLLKVDADGHEVKVLEGASGLIARRCVENIMIEISRETNGNEFNNLVRKIECIEQYGYGLNKIMPDGSLQRCMDRSILFPFLGRNNIVLCVSQ